MGENIYRVGKRDIIEQREYYSRHVDRMTGEKLHAKTDIAAELAHRDIQIDDLTEQLADALTREAETQRRHDGLRDDLTKREYFAGLAMQGLLSNGNGDAAPDYAVWQADALLKALEE
jgi:hypothetical protein